MWLNQEKAKVHIHAKADIMTLQVLKEVSQWAVDFRQPNHTYLMDGSKVIAYQQWHEGPAIYFSAPQNLVKTRRQFEKIKLKDSVFGQNNA